MLDMDIFPQIPGYRIDKKLGDSSIADVYLAVQEDLDRQVAIKVLNPKLFKEKDVLDRFLREARKAAQFVHPNIVNILEVGESEELHYIVMEHLPDSLRNRINAQFGLNNTPAGHSSLEGPEVMNVLKQLAWALDYAHKEGAVHRNIRPENIRFREDGTPVVVDFFVSRVLGAEETLKQKGIIFGSPHYGSPERALGKRLDGSSDIYSLGIVLYEMLLGGVPYDGEEAIAVENKHIMDPVPKLPEYLEYYQPLIDRMLAKNRDDRVPSGEELVQMIDQVNFRLHGGEPPAPTRKPKQSQQWGDLPNLDFSTVKDVKEEKRAKKEKSKKEKPIKEKPVKEKPIKEKSKKNKKEPVEEEALIPDISEFPDLSDDDLSMLEPAPEPSIPRRKKSLLNISFNLRLLIPIVAGIVIIGGVYFFVGNSSGGDEEFSYGRPKQTRSVKAAEEKTEQKELTEEEKQELEFKKKKFDYKFKMAERALNSGNLAQAEQKLAEAMKILDAPEGKKLAQQIEIKKKEQAEDNDFAAAKRAQTVQALEEFIAKYPSSRHKTAAEKAMALLKLELKTREKERRRILANRIKLRSEFANITITEVRDAVSKYNFYEKYYNKSGNFKNNYELRVNNTEKVVVDNATGLMWHHGGTLTDVRIEKGMAWLTELNANKYGGFSDWRLPTLEEALSLLEPVEQVNALFIDPLFDPEIKFIWTGDSYGKFETWALDFFGGDTVRVPPRGRAYIRPVRSFVNDR